MCYLPKGGDEERIPPSVPHITNVQDTQRDPHPNTTRYVGPGTHTRIALTPPLITGGAYESATPVCSGFLGGDLFRSSRVFISCRYTVRNKSGHAVVPVTRLVR
ncbi:hypothetical protein DPMN_167211 [Dreissena polymorpha]|uniref:Uncharacterized protein n=1 Tax=Dreissena polymorpha TaxID=45954 RepID=A0A9D4F0F7_DREPO|nr:hypothetical protein DPMN_167211 [Dreissena polymorpha]